MHVAANVKIDPKQDPELIAKLQAVAPYQYLLINPLVRKLLHESLDVLIERYGITVGPMQPARRAG